LRLFFAKEIYGSRCTPSLKEKNPAITAYMFMLSYLPAPDRSIMRARGLRYIIESIPV
jgi:hypothetical protein